MSEKTHGDFFWVFWIRSLYYMGVSALSFMMLYIRDMTLPQYGDETPPLGIPGASRNDQATHYTSLIALGAQVGALCLALPIGKLSDSHGRKPYITIACALMVVVYVAFMFRPSIEVAAPSVAARYCPSLPVTARHCPLLPATARY